MNFAPLCIAYFALCIIIEFLYLRFARVKGIGTTYQGRFMPVGGGVVFVFAAALPLVAGQCTMPMMLVFGGTLVMALLSYADDLLDLPAHFRLTIHLLTASVMSFPLFLLGQFAEAVIVTIFIAGFSNASNFMDGINGMLAAYTAVVAAEIILAINIYAPDLEGMSLLAIGVFCSAVVLMMFNFRKQPLLFSGDVGSVTAGFIVAAAISALCIRLGTITPVMLVSVFITDTFITFILRLSARKPLFKQHKEHLYQQLAAAGIPQLHISAAYALTQLLIAFVWLAAPQSILLAAVIALVLLSLRLFIPQFLKVQIDTASK